MFFNFEGQTNVYTYISFTIVKLGLEMGGRVNHNTTLPTPLTPYLYTYASELVLLPVTVITICHTLYQNIPPSIT